MTELEEKIIDVAYKDARSNSEYNSYLKMIINLEKQIKECLGAKQYLLDKYEDLINLSEGIYVKSAYLIGLNEGLNANNKIGMSKGMSNQILCIQWVK